jgi:uncharacterized protein YjiS (DUF1127 family)
MTTVTYGQATARDAGATLPGFLTRIAGGVRRYVTLSRATRQLEQLDDRLLADIGMKRSDINRMVWGGERR